MFPYPLGVITLVQGLYSLLVLAILFDVLSPTLDLTDLPKWGIGHGLGVLTLSFAVGTVMHTISRNLFHRRKVGWALEVITSPAVRSRMDDAGSAHPNGAPSLDDVHAAEGFEQRRRAAEFVLAVDHALMIHAPSVHQSIQVYKDQYRLARGFILPSLALAIILPFWEPVPSGHVGSFPLVNLQLFFLPVLFAGVCMYAFRERAYRDTAARVRSYLTLATDRGAMGSAEVPAVGAASIAG